MFKKGRMPGFLAVFSLAFFLVSCAVVKEVEKFTLDLRAENGGTTNPSPGKHTHDSGTRVTIEAKPDAGFVFSQWSGTATGAENPLTITMNSNKTLTASFARQLVLTIQTGSGGTTNPQAGTSLHNPGAKVAVEADPGLGYQFMNWSGDASGANAAITVSMDSDKTIMANFTIQQEDRMGVLTVAPGSTLQPAELDAVTLFGTSGLTPTGNFSVRANYADRFQMIFFVSKSTGKPVYLGLYNPSNGQVSADLDSTALALTLINPYLAYADQARREQFATVVRQNSKFTQLKQLLTNAYVTNANLALDYAANPLVYQLVAQLVKEVCATLGGGAVTKFAVGAALDLPSIKDVSGDGILFVNPRHVFYAAGVSGGKTDVVTVQRRESILSFNWGWPPIVVTEPEETPYTLGNGDFNIFLTKGWDFTLQWNDPKGRATICNTTQSILYILDLVLGFCPDLNAANLVFYLAITPEDQQSLSKAIKAFDVFDLIMDLAELLADNSENFARWIYQEFQTNAYHSLITSAAPIIKNVALAFKLIGLANEQAPFFFDLIFADDVAYFVRQENGLITTVEKNSPPTPAFSISPPAGVVGTDFSFDASSTSDDHDTISGLQFRWDWETDGNWDTEWTGATGVNHSYSEQGSHLVSLEVKDSKGLVAHIAHSLSVGGGAGTASHVKLFRDVLPWSSNATVNVLRSLGFTYGTGPNTYEIIPSGQMAYVALNPQEDLVIISNDQTQSFYNNYAASQLRFTNFVFMGGSLLWEACDAGWNNGSLAAAGIILPGNLVTNLDYDYWNYISNSDLPLVSGLPTAMDHNMASHESFSNYPDGTTIYCINEESEPTLIEFNLGGGWIIVSGQPLEHQYDRLYGAPDMGYLLPRLIAYFTGVPMPVAMQTQSAERSTIPSSIRR